MTWDEEPEQELPPLEDMPEFADMFRGFSQWCPLPEELEPFGNFACYLLRELGLAEEPTKQQLSIVEYLELPVKRKALAGFRGIAKSTFGAFRALHRLRIDPFHEKGLIPGCTAEKAVEVCTFMLSCIRDIDILQCLAPLPDGRSSAKSFDVGPSKVDQSPSMRAVGILSPSLTGKRCTFAYPDDIETLNNSITPLKQERLRRAITELEMILKPDDSQAILPREIVYFGTPHIETSLYLELYRKKGYIMRYIPARYPNPEDPEQWDCYDGHLDPLIRDEVLADRSLIGEPTDPERFGHEELLEREIGAGSKAVVQLQFQLNCRLSTADRFPIRLADLIVMDLDGKALPETVAWGGANDLRIPDLVCTGLGSDRWYHKPALINGWIPKTEHWSCALAIDPSGRGKDELAWAVVAELNGNLFLLECGGTTAGYADTTLEHLAAVAKRWAVTNVVAESNMGDGMFTALLQPVMHKVYPVSIEEVRVSIQKERRIVDTLAPLVQQHRLVVAADVIRRDYEEAERNMDSGHPRSLMFQLSRITTDRGCLQFDDRIDGLATAAAWFVEAAAQDQVRQRDQREQENFDQALNDLFLEWDSHADALAMGFTGTGRARAVGGIKR